MSENQKPATLIGSKEPVDFPALGLFDVPAKVDTGADSSAIWASNIKKGADALSFVLFDRQSPYYTGKTIETQDFKVTSVRNSFGQVEYRYKVKLKVTIAGRRIIGNFTLANRSNNRFPVLLGRRTLKGKFLVDVSQGNHAERIDMLLLTIRDSAHIREFIAGVQAANKNLHITFGLYDDLDFVLGEDASKVVLHDSGRDIASFDIVQFKAVPQRYSSTVSSAAQYLRKHGVQFIDQASANTSINTKLYQYAMLNNHGIAIPLSMFVAPARLAASYSAFVEALGLPFVLKDINGKKGRDNFLIRNEDDFNAACSEASDRDLSMIAQAFIENDSDYRVLVMGNRIELAFRRMRTRDDTHLNNTSQGAEAVLLQPNELPESAQHTCLYASQLLQRDVAGVDVLQDKRTGSWYCLEVNDDPQVATGAFIAEKHTAFAQFIDREVRRQR